VPEKERDLSGLVRSWLRPNELHISGCPSAEHYTGLCSDECLATVERLAPFTVEEVASLPIRKSADE
jgi:hypothetical protein